MKTTDICIEEFPIGFTGENTFICGKGETLQSIALAELSKLKAENNTILVTDPYLFPYIRNPSEEQTYNGIGKSIGKFTCEKSYILFKRKKEYGNVSKYCNRTSKQRNNSRI